MPLNGTLTEVIFRAGPEKKANRGQRGLTGLLFLLSSALSLDEGEHASVPGIEAQGSERREEEEYSAMSVRMALAKLCACACGGAVIGGGAVHIAELHPVVHRKMIRRVTHVRRPVTTTTTTCTPGARMSTKTLRGDRGRGEVLPTGTAARAGSDHDAAENRPTDRRRGHGRDGAATGKTVRATSALDSRELRSGAAAAAVRVAR